MTVIDLEQARYNMIEQQIRPWEVLDQRVLDVLSQVPREEFVPERYRQLAFVDVPIPLMHDQTMMKPNVEGRVLQALDIQPGDSVLEVGTGSGYLTACLAQLGARVVSVDIFPEFSERVQSLLGRHGINNVYLQTGDAARDWDEGNDRRYDTIALTGALPEVTDAWRRRLAVGGRLFMIIGEAPVMEAVLVTRASANEWLQDSLFETELPYLLHAEAAPKFEF